MRILSSYSLRFGKDRLLTFLTLVLIFNSGEAKIIMHKKKKTSSKRKHKQLFQNKNEINSSSQGDFQPSAVPHETLVTEQNEDGSDLQITSTQKYNADTKSTDKIEIRLLGNQVCNLNLDCYRGDKSSSARDCLVRDFFLHYLCQVCKQIPDIPILCKKCQIITYCCDEHRRNHWPIHMEICDAIQEICRNQNIDHIMQNCIGLSAEEFKNYRFLNMTMCEQIVTRKLELWEKEIFLHPNVCEICYEYDNRKLKQCKTCHHISFCSLHETETHKFWCYALINYREFVQYHCKYGIVDVSHSLKTYSSCPILSGFENVLQKTKSSIQYLELTEIASGPLTTLHALQPFCNEVLKSKNSLVIHLIGAESNFETKFLEKWEFYFMHLVPNLKILEVIFVGPELNINYEESKGKHRTCETCQQNNRRIKFQFVSALYHDYANSKTFSLPGIICSFNPGLYRSEGFAGLDTWPMTIKAMFSMRKLPIVLTAYTKMESELDVQRVKKITKINILKGPSKNPFSSLKPTLNFVSEHETPVIFKNFYYTIIYMN